MASAPAPGATVMMSRIGRVGNPAGLSSEAAAAVPVKQANMELARQPAAILSAAFICYFLLVILWSCRCSLQPTRGRRASYAVYLDRRRRAIVHPSHTPARTMRTIDAIAEILKKEGIGLLP